MIDRIVRAFTRWKFERPMASDFRCVDAVVVQAYSRSRSGSESGEANQEIAHTAQLLYDTFRLPVLSMTEIEMADPDLRADFIYRGHTGGHSTQDCNTFTIAFQHANYCKQKGYSCVVVVASPDHIGRCLWEYERLGLTALPFPVDISHVMSDDYLHWSHRTRARFVVREFFVRLLFLAKGYI